MVDFSIVMLVFRMYPTIFVDQNTTRYPDKCFLRKVPTVFMGLPKVNFDGSCFQGHPWKKSCAKCPEIEEFVWKKI